MLCTACLLWTKAPTSSTFLCAQTFHRAFSRPVCDLANTARLPLSFSNSKSQLSPNLQIQMLRLSGHVVEC